MALRAKSEEFQFVADSLETGLAGDPFFEVGGKAFTNLDDGGT